MIAAIDLEGVLAPEIWPHLGDHFGVAELHLEDVHLGELVRRLEEGAIDFLAGYGIEGSRRQGMPGVYVDGAKIAAIGLRIARGCSYHGIAMNVDLDLEPFSRIDPCGYPGLRATSLAALGARATIDAAQQGLGDALARALAAPPPDSQ